MTAHGELRARLKAYHDADDLYHGPDPYDREESRYLALCEARARVGDVRQAEALVAEHAALLDEIAALRAERAWKPIETAPMDGRFILVCGPEWGTPEVGWYGDGLWWTATGSYDQPTHWMPLPEAQ